MSKATGYIYRIGDTEKVSEKFTKRNFVLEIDRGSPYPQFIEFQVTQNKCSILDKISVGQKVDVSYNLRGRIWNDGPDGARVYNTLEAWKIEQIAD